MNTLELFQSIERKLIAQQKQHTAKTGMLDCDINYKLGIVREKIWELSAFKEERNEKYN